MSRARCCVPGCIESGNSHPTLHGFPHPEKYPDLFRSWVYAVGGDILGLSNQYIYMQRRVCHAHFEQKYCCRYNRISKIAVPSINIPGPLTLPTFTFPERRPLREMQNILFASPSTSQEPVIYEPEITQTLDETDINMECQEERGKENATTVTEPVISEAEMGPSNKMDINTKCQEEGNKKHSTSVAVGLRSAPKKLKIRQIGGTKHEQKLRNILVSLRIKLSKCRNMVKKQKLELSSAKKIFSNPELLKIMDTWTIPAKIFTLIQFREHKKKAKGRRFSMQDKIVALTLYKQSPKGYRLLRIFFILPAEQTLIKILHKCSLTAGINKSIMMQLKTRAEKMKPEHRVCSLIFDEMQLKANITYNERKDVISGFVTDGLETKRIIADHAQVFMLRGIIKNFKQPLAYTFSAGATKGIELAKQIKIIIKELQEIGFRVIATVCDQGTNNRQAIRLLKEETRVELLHLRQGDQDPNNNIFEINGQKVVPIYDPPHLIKCLRNNLLTKDLQYKLDGKVRTAKWQHVELLYKENPGYKGLRLMPKLTENHVIPSKISKMKVKYATQIFSRSVSSTMGYLSEKGILPEECKDTADFLHFADNLVDSVNGSHTKNKHAKPLLGPVTPHSLHHKTWAEALKVLNTMVFINKKTLKNEIVPTIEGWKTTINGLREIVKILEKEYKWSSVWMRHFNQDPIENFFGAIRSHGCRNTNPSTAQFESAFTTLLVNNMTSVHAPGSNCESDNAELLFTLVLPKDNESKKSCEVDLNDILEINLVPLTDKGDPRIIAPLKYVSGYFIKKAKFILNCKTCKESLLKESDPDIRYREYAGLNWLHCPNDDYLKAMSEIQDICNYIIPKYIEKPILKEYISVIVATLVDCGFMKCAKHKNKFKEYLTNKTVRFFIYNYCKIINKIIYGRRCVDDNNDPIQVLAKAYFNKCWKNKK